jgi:hypothetical protein
VTFFLLGLIGGVALSASALIALLRSDKRTNAVCRALSALHAIEAPQAKRVSVASAPTPPIALSQDAYSEVVASLVALGATKAQALQRASIAMTLLTSQGVVISGEVLLRSALSAPQKTSVQ